MLKWDLKWVNINSVFGDRVMSLRAVGFCKNERCIKCYAGVFLSSYKRNFFSCASCGRQGHVEHERSIKTNKTINILAYREVKVHFSFDPEKHKYDSIAIVSINELNKGATYELFTPFVHTEQRALKVAETILSSLNNGSMNREGSLTQETVLNLDQKDWDKQLKSLTKKLEERERRLNSGY